jgi:AcrR family transcriptional regulator
MENTARSQRTRDAAIQAALTIIARDGPSKLTIDAIARESGISKGGVLHQFRTKEAVLKAVLEHQITTSEAFFQDFLGKISPSQSEPILEAQIATLRAAAAHPQSTTFALAGVLAEAPDLLALVREMDARRVEDIKDQASDPNIALVRWAAAKGLALAAILGQCPLSGEERDRLFECLQNDKRWAELCRSAAPVNI